MYLSAKAAAARLGVSRTTLYAYVSRGLVRSRARPGTRAREYAAADVEALIARKQARADPSVAAAAALGVRGLPVLDSALTSVADGRTRYRGHDVTTLAGSRTLEEVAALLWDGPLADQTAPRVSASTARLVAGLPTIPAMQAWLAAAGPSDDAAYHLSADGVRRTGVKILRGVAGVAGSSPVERGATVADTLASAWACRRHRASIDAALILCADHELNVSAFTARCVASARATPYMVVTAALAALQGHRHGGEAERTAAMIDETGSPSTVLAARLRRGERVPGFGHPLYPQGDPRGRALLSIARASGKRTKHAERIDAFIEAGRDLLDAAPTLDLGLVALSRALRLPPSAPLALFAVGRTVGWIAHAIEQYASEPMIRPRARYVGPEPVD